MSICELYKDQDITIRINGNVYHGPIKRMYQTFYEKIIEIPFNSEWFPAKIIGEASEKEIYCINDAVMCTIDLIKNNKIQITSSDISLIRMNITSDWLFGIEFQDSNNEWYTLMDGYNVSAK